MSAVAGAETHADETPAVERTASPDSAQDSPGGLGEKLRCDAAYRREHGYVITSYSLYESDVECISKHVARLKALGWSGASKSALVRAAIARLDEAALVEIADEKRRTR